MNQQNYNNIEEEVNFRILNYIQSNYQGLYAENNLILSLNTNPQIKANINLNLEGIKKYLTRFKNYILNLDKEILIFDLNNPNNNQEETEMFIILNDIKSEILQRQKAIENIYNLKNEEIEENHIKFLLENFSFYNYFKNNLIKGYKDFYSARSVNQATQVYTMQLENSEQDITQINAYLEHLKNSKNSYPQIQDHLFFFARLLKNHFKAQVNEINQMLKLKSNQYTFHDAGFSPVNREAWEAAGFNPIEAGLWKAYDFKPKEVFEFIKNGIQDPTIAAEWTTANFSLKEIFTWAQFGFSSALALIWKNADYSADQSALFISHNYYSPEDLPKEEDKIKEILDLGFNEE